MCHYGVEVGQPGDVRVVDGAGYTEGALWGGLLTRTALQGGLAGIVIDGAARDVDKLQLRGLPICARAVTPRGVVKSMMGETGVPVACGGIVISPGDLMIGDSDGLVAIPRDKLAEMFPKARQILAREYEFIIEINPGGSIYSKLGLERLFSKSDY